MCLWVVVSIHRRNGLDSLEAFISQGYSPSCDRLLECGDTPVLATGCLVPDLTITAELKPQILGRGFPGLRFDINFARHRFSVSCSCFYLR